MVDIHSHILPGVDDGAKSWKMAIAMCRAAAEDGIQHMVASPPANYEFAYHRDNCEAALEKLAELIGRRIDLTLGCDFHLSFENLEDAWAHPEKYVIGRTSYILVELSDFSFSLGTRDALQRLLSMRLIPIVTHPERNPRMQQRPEQVLELVQQGCRVQVTANSLTGFWGKRSQEIACWLLDREAVHVIATDAHDLQRRPPILSKARDYLSKTYGNKVAQALVENNPSAIIANLPIAHS